MDLLTKIAEALGLATPEHRTEFLDRYEIVRDLGSGAMGTVHLARHVDTGERRVIKEQVAENRGDRNRIQNEIDVGTAVDHPGICSTHAYQVDGSTYYLLQDYVEGPPLRQLLRDWTIEEEGEPPFIDETTFGNVFFCLTDALNVIHRNGYLHLDVKPGNILIRRDGDRDGDPFDPYIIDFGVAVPQSETISNPKGSMFHMAPEVAGVGLFDRGEVGPRSDLYSLGATMYELATGRPPHLPAFFRDRDENWNRLWEQYQKQPDSVRREHEKNMLRSRLENPADFSLFPYGDRLAEITRNCLKIPPARRYPNADRVLQALRTVR